MQVSTVDAFQGAEKEIIILSCVRTRQVGFIDSEKRMNVALTRGRRHLLIVGNLACLRKNQLWGRVIQHCEGKIKICLIQAFWIKTDFWVGAWNGSGGNSSGFATVGDDWNSRGPLWNIVVSFLYLFKEGKMDYNMQVSMNHSWTIFLKIILKNKQKKNRRERMKKINLKINLIHKKTWYR